MSKWPWPLILIVCAYLAAGGLYAASAPLLDVSDEVRHYAMVEQLAQGKGLPVQDPATSRAQTRRELTGHSPLTYYAQEGSQPPLYYALMAVVALPFDRSDWPERVWPNPHALLGRADATSNWNQLLHTPDELAPPQKTALVVMVMRLIGVMLGALAVICTFYLARAVSMPSRRVAVLAASLVAFNPMFVHIMASVNNDTLAVALASLALLMGARMIQRGPTVRRELVLGIVLGGAALAKASGLALAATVPLFVLLSAWRRLTWQRAREKSSGKDQTQDQDDARTPVVALIPLAAALVGPAAVIAGWWYVRNFVLYGDLTGTTMMATIAGAREYVPTTLELLGEWDGFFKSYWGLFGAVNIPMHPLVYVALEVLTALAGLGLVLAVGRWLIHVFRPPAQAAVDAVAQAPSRSPIQVGEVARATRAQPLSGLDWADSASGGEVRVLIVLMLLVAFAVALIALVRWTSLTLASQGRLLFPVIAPISVFMALGLTRLVSGVASGLGRQPASPGARLALALKGWVPGGIMATLALLTLAAPFIYIRKAYQTPVILPNPSALPSDITLTELYFEDKIRWIGYRVETPRQRVRPGETLDVTLYWQGLKPLDKNYSAFIRLYGRDVVTVTLLDTYPGGGMWQTTEWRPGQVVADRYRLRIGDTLTNTRLMPTALKLDVGFWDYTTQHFLTTLDGGGKPTGRQRYEVAGLNDHAGGATQGGGKPETLEPDRFERATMRAISVTQQGQAVNLKLDWIVTDDFSDDYTTFVQLFDITGKQLPLQGDMPALSGQFAPKWWRRDDIIAGDTYTITLPNDFPSGQYTLAFGLYNKGNVRMPAFDAHNQPIPDSAIHVPIMIQSPRK